MGIYSSMFFHASSSPLASASPAGDRLSRLRLRLRLALPVLILRLPRRDLASSFAGFSLRLAGEREREREMEGSRRLRGGGEREVEGSRRLRGGERERDGEGDARRLRFFGGGDRLSTEGDLRRRWWAWRLRLGDRERRL